MVAIGPDDANVAPRQDVALDALDADDGVVRLRDGVGHDIVRRDVQKTEAVSTRAPGQTPTCENRNFRAAIKADAPTEEHDGRVGRPVEGERARIPSAKIENTLPLEKELAFLGKEEAEAGEVHLGLFGLDLGEIGVVREVENESFRHAIFRVEAEIGVARVLERYVRGTVGAHRTGRVGLHLEVHGALGRLDSDERGGEGQLQQTLPIECRGNGHELAALVLPLHPALEVDAP